MSPTPVIAVVLVPFVIWRVYNRIRRLMVRQRSQMWRHWIGVTAFPIIAVLLAIVALANPLALAGMAAGIACGAALGFVGLKKTQFEHTGGEFYYTPHAGIGVAVSLLFLGRLGFRAYEFYVHQGAPENFGSSPLTLLVFGVLAGYYTVYAAGLLRWRKQAQ